MPVDANAPVPSDPPIYADAPDLQVSREGNTVSPRHPKEKIWLSDSMQADEAGTEVFRWAYFNKFEVELPEVTHTEWRPAQTGMPQVRTVSVGDGMCQQEQASVEAEYSYKFALLQQYYEQWVTDTALKEYYDTLLGVEAGAAAGGVGVAGLFGDLAFGSVTAGIEAGTITTTTGTLAGAGTAGTVAAAGGTIAVGASFTTAFLGTTALMSKIVEHTEVRSSGWAVIGKWKYDDAPTGETRTTWARIGVPFPCASTGSGTTGGTRVGGADLRPVTPEPAKPAEPTTPPRPGALRRAWLRFWWLIVLAILVILALIVALVFMFLPRGTTSAGGSGQQTATQYTAPASCSSTTHSPHPLFPGSPSWWLLVILAVAQNGALLPGTTFEAETPGADVDSVSGVVSPEGAMVAAVPVSSFADYEAGDVRLTAPDGTVSTIPAGSLAVQVGPDEAALSCTGETDDRAVLEDAANAAPLGTDAASAFAAEYQGWHETGDAVSLLSSLHPAVIARYGEEQCSAYLDGVVGSITDLTVSDQVDEPWDYPLDGMTSQILDSSTLTITAWFGDAWREGVEFHVAPYDRTARWFTDCGEPVD